MDTVFGFIIGAVVVGVIALVFINRVAGSLVNAITDFARRR